MAMGPTCHRLSVLHSSTRSTVSRSPARSEGNLGKPFGSVVSSRSLRTIVRDRARPRTSRSFAIGDRSDGLRRGLVRLSARNSYFYLATALPRTRGMHLAYGQKRNHDKARSDRIQMLRRSRAETFLRVQKRPYKPLLCCLASSIVRNVTYAYTSTLGLLLIWKPRVRVRQARGYQLAPRSQERVWPRCVDGSPKYSPSPEPLVFCGVGIKCQEAKHLSALDLLNRSCAVESGRSGRPTRW